MIRSNVCPRMTSTNEHLLPPPPPPKPRTSPMEFRNPDLVSRLLAATPPYLSNMELLPNTFFFSELLKSIVQAKIQRTATFQPPVRRPRKRSWATSRSECLGKAPIESKSEDILLPPPLPPPPPPQASAPPTQEALVDWMLKGNKKQEENPLELTINKNENPNIFPNHTKVEQSIPQMFPNIHHNIPQDNNSQNLVLPPPPPIWYPPLYPTSPFAIDPLHFFIDLRVSGHIYDKKNQRDNSEASSSSASSSPREKPHTEVSTPKVEPEISNNAFKQSRNCSAFSVPIPSSSRSNYSDKETKPTKFDVKSMGFDKSSNKTSINYVMSNISNIYKNIQQSQDVAIDFIDEGDEEKRVRDLRAALGLDLVVDYMKHKNPRSSNDESSISTDYESVGSPHLDVVDEN
uniref:Uncharacterized protein LOC114327602 isoform X1 n=2 Tax=Diabrotica virgifera virgifera TaxID=50390 RepID=A0A6P7FB92_DIAVI